MVYYGTGKKWTLYVIVCDFYSFQTYRIVPKTEALKSDLRQKNKKKVKKGETRTKVTFVSKLAQLLESPEFPFIHWSPEGDYLIIQRDEFEVRIALLMIERFTLG